MDKYVKRTNEDVLVDRTPNSISENKGTSSSVQPKIAKKINEDWLKAYPWLKKVQNEKVCFICNVKVAGTKYHIQRHGATETHKKLELEARSSPKINNFLSQVRVTDSVKNDAQNLELMLTNFVAEHNLPFSVLDHLGKLLKNGITDSNIVKKCFIHRKKATKIVADCTGPSNFKQVVEICKKQYYSIIIDESTDCTTTKNLAILVRIFNEKCIDRFLTLTKIPDGSSNSIFNIISKVFQDNDIPFTNLVGFGADNCSVMMGRNNGVQALLSEIQPSLYVSGCICHNLNLASQHASECLPNEIDKLLKSINKYFCNSSSRKEDFAQFQKYFNSETHTILKYSPTRWLSRQVVIDRIIEQWNPLLYYFTLSDFESKENEKTNFILRSLKDDNKKMYFLFLSYVLKIINDIIIEMQSEDTRIHIIIVRLTFLFRQLSRNFLNKRYIDDLHVADIDLNSHQLSTEEIYCGAEVELFITKKCISVQSILEFKLNIKTFYISFLSYLRKKYNFKDYYLNWFPKFSPQHVLSGDTNNIVPFILKLFPSEETNIEKINCEYRSIAEFEELKRLENYTMSKFWKEVGDVRNTLNEPLFSNIFRIAQGILSIPHSSASVERVFSVQNLIKTKVRNRLQLESLSSLIHTKDFLKSNNLCCYDNQVSKILKQKNVTNLEIPDEYLLD